MAEDNQYALPFSEMAEDINRNPEQSFGGAFVIVLAGDSGNQPRVIKGSVFGMADAEAILSLVGAKISDAINDMEHGGNRIR